MDFLISKIGLYLLQSSLNDSSRTRWTQICCGGISLRQSFEADMPRPTAISVHPFQTQISCYVGRYTGIIIFLNRKILTGIGKAEWKLQSLFRALLLPGMYSLLLSCAQVYFIWLWQFLNGDKPCSDSSGPSCVSNSPIPPRWDQQSERIFISVGVRYRENRWTSKFSGPWCFISKLLTKNLQTHFL